MNNRVILMFLMLWMPFLSYSYGLGFYDSTHPIAARTSYNVLGKKECRFKDRFILSFSMSVETPLEIGYVCRIKSSASGGGSIYNLFFDLRGDDYLFRFNEEGKSVLASLPRDKQKLLRDHWFDVVVDINLRSKEISLDIDGERKIFKAKSLPDVFEPEIVFGKSDYLLDVTSLRKAAEILTEVNGEKRLASECTALADEVEAALKQYAVYDHPEFGKIYAFEVDGFGNRMLMDDANVPSLLAMPYLGDVEVSDPVYQNTRRFVWSDSNPYFFKGRAGEGIGGPHVGYDMIWPMSIMMKAFTSDDDAEIKECVEMLMATDAGTNFMHESFHKDNADKFTRPWFAWQNTLFGELIIKLIDDGRLGLLNSIE